MRIRSLTFAYTLGLGLLAMAGAAAISWQSWGRLANVHEMHSLIGALAPEIKLPEALALERGVYNQVLVSKEWSIDDSRALVSSQAAFTDGLFENVEREIKELPPAVRSRVALPFLQAWEIIRAARAKGDAIWREPGERSPEAAESMDAEWDKAAELLDKSTASAERALTECDPALGMGLEVSNLSNSIRDFAGRRSNIIDRYPATLQPFSRADHVRISELSGALHVTWDRLQRAAQRTGETHVEGDVAHIRDSFFKVGEPLYISMADAARQGTKPPLDFMKWRKWTAAMLTQTLAARDAPIQEATSQINGMRSQALRSVQFAVAAFAGILTLLLAAGYFVQSRVVDPLVRMAKALDRPPSGSKHEETQELASRLGERGDEIGSLARAVARHQRRAIELETLNQKFNAVLSNLPQGVCFYDADDRLVVSNNRYAELYGIDPKVIRSGMHLKEVIALRNSMGDGEIEEEGERILDHGRHVVKTRTGLKLAVHANSVPGGGWLATHLDNTSRMEAEARIVHMARHDALTDLPNRQMFLETLESMITNREDRSFAVLYLDLDRFKGVNDSLGHGAGDALLKAAASRLKGAIRDGDLVARLGGDEFAVIQRLADPTEAGDLSERIIATLNAPYQIEGKTLVVGASIGIAVAPRDGEDAERLIRNADLALYATKAGGRGRYSYFRTEFDSEIRAHQKLEADLRLALERHEFELYFQPLVSIHDRRIRCFEALLRWNSPDRGLVGPPEFIEALEELGLIIPLGAWVLHEACRQAMLWPGEIKVAVNLSVVQFRDKDLIDSVRNALSSSGLPGNRLELEITESLMIQEVEGTISTLHEFRKMGIQIGMDDFGTGYSSLRYLRLFPFDKIKIDRSFVSELGVREDCAVIVRAATSIARSLDMTATAEGVETEDQLQRAAMEGCTEAQGYLFSEPMPANLVRSFLEEILMASYSLAAPSAYGEASLSLPGLTPTRRVAGKY